MSAIKRFFSSHKTSSNSKINHNQQHENQTSQNKSSTIVEKGVTVANGTVDHEETKENMAPPPFPSTEILLKYIIRIESCSWTQSILLFIKTGYSSITNITTCIRNGD
jgi:hypothetical protein